MRSVRQRLLGGNLPTLLSIPLEISPYTDLMLSRNFRNLVYSDGNDFSTHITIMYNKLAQVSRMEERSNK